VSNGSPSSGDDTESGEQPEIQQDDDGLFGQQVRGVLWSTLERGGSGIISLVVHITLARLLAPEAFGLVAMAYVTINLLGLFKDQGFEEAIIQRAELDDAHLDVALWSLVALSTVLTVAGLVASPFIADFFGEPRLTEVLSALMLTIPMLSIQSVPTALLQREMRFRTLSIRSLIASGISGVVAIVMAATGYGVWSLVAKYLLHQLVGAIILWSAADWWPRLRFSRRHLRELITFGATITVTRVINYFNRNLDDILIGRFLGPEALGYYSIAYEILLGLTNVLSRTFSAVAFPTFSRLQDDITRLREAFLEAVHTISLLAFPVFSLFAAVAPDLIVVVFGEKWLPSAPVARVLALIGIMQSVALLHSPILNACGKPKWDLGLTIVDVIGNTIGFVIAVRYGIVWVAAAYVIVGYATLPIPLMLIRRLVGMRLSQYLRQIAFPVVGSVVMLGCVLAVEFFVPQGWPTVVRLVLGVVVGLGVYLVAAYLGLPGSSRRLMRRIRDEVGV
jgi:PST family polysaccharide transporter